MDAGLMFPGRLHAGGRFRHPRHVLPPAATKPRVQGIVLTHAHEDHIGALPFLLQRDRRAGLRHALHAGAGAAEAGRARGRRPRPACTRSSPDEPLPLGPFDARFHPRGPQRGRRGRARHRHPRGPDRAHRGFQDQPQADGGQGTDVRKFARCGERGVLALLSDSTNIEREGATVPDTPDRRDARRGSWSGSPGRIIVALFASNIGRIQMIVDIARAGGPQGDHQRPQHRGQRRDRQAPGAT
ncbi:MAG: MBL fold metallo-hydrolase [Desulfobacterales bacterium]|nr:MBL fold metallo-hydrolase [Desulfobacterales bacterium]